MGILPCVLEDYRTVNLLVFCLHCLVNGYRSLGDSMKAAVLKRFVLFFVLSIHAYADDQATEVHEDGVDEKALRARTSPDFDEATRKIREMVKRDTVKFTKLGEEYAEKIKKGMDNGKISEVLHEMLTAHDTWYPENEEEVFVDTDDKGEKINRLEKLSASERMLISLDYTKERQKLRALIHEKVAALLKGSKDLRIQALEKELANLKKLNLNAWDHGLKKIVTNFKKEGKGSPICFTCGEPVSDDPDYEFSSAMEAGIAKSLETVGLAKKDAPYGKAFFNAVGFSRTKEGKLVKALMNNNGELLGYTGDNSAEDQKKSGTDRDLVAATRNYYAEVLARNSYKMDKVFPGNTAAQNQVNSFFKWADSNVLNKPAAPVLAAVGAIPANSSQPSTSALDTYLAGVQGHPDAKSYETPETMAAAIGLVDKEGKPYLEYKGKGKHFDGTNEYGVRMLWDKIRYAEPEERGRVMKILQKIASETGPARYKVTNGQDGYCIWCNIRNDTYSISQMRELK